MKHLFSIILISIIFITPVRSKQEVKNGNDLVHKMHEKYYKKWYSNLTFKQQTIFYKEGRVSKEELWHEAMQIPKGLIIKIEDIHGGNGLLFKNDSMTVFKDGKAANKMRRVHELLVLGFSVYLDNPETTISKLEEVGFNLNIVKTDTIDNKSYYVVGEPSKKQFWIDTEHLLFTKVETHYPNGTISTTEFMDYEKLNEAWIAPTVIFYKDGEIIMKETYYDIEVPKKLPKNLLDSSRFSEMEW
ncbi:outer membrane lipoprotein-sorting protein [Pontimicrobium aquaticum]|uniref:Outer membrane lipoprotein-sorting protein n=1 Tax=Pontimicrobium aquaticum TaxID=2565367 RepID=A0A4V5LR39_9FLAO|nr:outer membrane lipoprotein-sorting protein [Pontimicrobium aquaticum]TJY37809.1 hypothetical protein E5167_00715 [Pontimicrobium aquaticum]